MLSVGARLGDRYEILGQLGTGGMGEVYRARDLRLGREVAVKVLPEGLAGDAQALARFKREARALAALSHDHILTIHDFGTDQGISFAVMELLKGQTLRAFLAGSRSPLPRMLEIAIAVAEGLAAAHSEGVIHRDLKPENIFVTSDGRVRILDFGLAQWMLPVSSPEATDASTITGTDHAVIAGTVPYMSPEQLRGETVDNRSDIFSFGSVLYEMVSGSRPFKGKTQIDTMSSILKEEPAGFAPDLMVPAALEECVSRCLKKNAAERFQSTQDLVFALKLITRESTPATSPTLRREPSRKRSAVWLILVLIVLTTLTLISWYALHRKSFHSIAILPFVNETGDPNAEYLSDGITDSLIDGLSQLPDLHVMARDTVYSYKEKRIDPRTVGHDLGVAAVVTGRVLHQQDTLVIRAQLIDVSDGTQIWGEQFNEKSENVLTIQEEISGRISEKLQIKLFGPSPSGAVKHYTQNNEAYQLYLKGLYHWYKATPEDYEESLENFQAAIQKDPSYALGYAGLARAYLSMGIDGDWPSSRACPQGRKAVTKAVELDSTLAEARIAQGILYYTCDWDLERGLREWRRGVELSPNNADLRRYSAQLLGAARHFDEAIAEAKKAQELDPLSADKDIGLGTVYFWTKRFDDAIEQYKKAVDLDPNSALVHSLLSDVYASKGMYPESISELQRSLTLLDNGDAAAELGNDFASMGYQKAMQTFYEQYLEALKDSAQESYVSPHAIAIANALLNHKDEAFLWLNKAYDEHSQTLAYIQVTPELDNLRSDPRFTALLKKMGFSK